ncbi:dihydrodipicolinate synthase family protein [Aureibacillus halotolerans]|uniref:4-hydroxy-tetrahydrodipicolinate synthase n=1 Tax=Aureibacillus halotolerans TaxID=1508390 RepID=A0A4R6U636_9BACI|nr:dihydrodipicolinate synthase family protein [Aureibacillus halotolerans]TDQ41701.1 4-hydroxy-tetrahydrodipicolinate synthase [Aureibacillus halotolerans]
MLTEAYHVTIPTAFSQNEELEIEHTLNHIQNLYDKGVKSVLVCGTTGEQHSLNTEEKRRLIEALDGHGLSKKMEILFGVGAVRQKDAVMIAEAISKTNIAGMVLGFPPYIVPTQDEITIYIKKVVEAGGKPTILYNSPARTGFDLSEDTIIKTFNSLKLVIGLKESGPKSKETLAYIKESCPGIYIYAGGDIDLKNKLQKGFNRLSSVAGNIDPNGIHDWFNRLIAGEENQMHDDAIHSLLNSTYTKRSIIINVKAELNKQGIQMGICRSPLGNC